MGKVQRNHLHDSIIHQPLRRSVIYFAYFKMSLFYLIEF